MRNADRLASIEHLVYHVLDVVVLSRWVSLETLVMFMHDALLCLARVDLGKLAVYIMIYIGLSLLNAVCFICVYLSLSTYTSRSYKSAELPIDRHHVWSRSERSGWTNACSVLSVLRRESGSQASSPPSQPSWLGRQPGGTP